jgi:hypothetical protein
MAFPRWNLSLGYLMDTPDFIYALTRDDVMRWIKELAHDRLIGRYALNFVGHDRSVEAWLVRAGEKRLFLVAERGVQRERRKSLGLASDLSPR